MFQTDTEAGHGSPGTRLEVKGNLKPDSISSKRLGPLFCSVDQSQGHPAQCGGGTPKALLICL